MNLMLQLLKSSVLMLASSLVLGCGAGEAGDTSEPALTEALPEFTPDTSTLSSLTTVDMVDCSICAGAKACCNAVSTRPGYCDNFNAERCTTLDPGRQRTTKINCLMFLRTAISAWRLAGRTPPSACHIPGEE